MAPHSSLSAQLRLASSQAAISGLSPGGCFPELLIQVGCPGHAQFVGSANQLIAEGVIPDGFEWPRGAASKAWVAGELSYFVRRVRPIGHRGPKRTWLTLDHWLVWTQLADRRRAIRLGLDRRADELRADYVRLLTETGQREFQASSDRYWKAVDDDAYQAFKGRIPVLASMPVGRGCHG